MRIDRPDRRQAVGRAGAQAGIAADNPQLGETGHELQAVADDARDHRRIHPGVQADELARAAAQDRTRPGPLDDRGGLRPCVRGVDFLHEVVVGEVGDLGAHRQVRAFDHGDLALARQDWQRDTQRLQQRRGPHPGAQHQMPAGDVGCRAEAQLDAAGRRLDAQQFVGQAVFHAARLQVSRDLVAGEHRLHLAVVRPPGGGGDAGVQRRLDAAQVLGLQHFDPYAARGVRVGVGPELVASRRIQGRQRGALAVVFAVVAERRDHRVPVPEALDRKVEQHARRLVGDQEIAVRRARGAGCDARAVHHQQPETGIGQVQRGEAADDAGADDGDVVARHGAGAAMPT
jgi:hypothetical protein